MDRLHFWAGKRLSEKIVTPDVPPFFQRMMFCFCFFCAFAVVPYCDCGYFIYLFRFGIHHRNPDRDLFIIYLYHYSARSIILLQLFACYNNVIQHKIKARKDGAKQTNTDRPLLLKYVVLRFHSEIFPRCSLSSIVEKG